MNLGDGLKLETEVLDGKPRLILASYGKSKPAVKMGNKARVPKHALRIRHTGHVSRSTQNAFIKHESLTNPRSESSLSMTKREKLQITANNSSHEAPTKDHSLIFQRENTSRKFDSENFNVVKKGKQKPQNPHTSAEDLRRSLVCLTQEQLEQILTTVKEGTRSLSEIHNEKQEEMAANEASEENTVTLLQKAGEISSVPDEANSDSSRKQAYPQAEQKVVVKNSWKPTDMFSTLGEREGDKALLEFKKTQWKKELDEQVALKKKLKETLEGEVGYFWKRPGSDKTCSEKMGTADPDKTMFPADSITTADEKCVCRTILTTEANEVSLSVSRGPAGQCSDFSSDLPAVNYTALVLGEAAPQERPLSAMKHEQQKKCLEELDKQKEEAKLRKIEEKLSLSKAEEHDRWAMHFDSLKNHLNANAQHPLNGMYKKQPEILCLSPDPKELTAFIHPFSPAALGNLMPSKVGNAEKAAKNSALEHSQKVSFLRSMTALLDPAQIEERERRRQKQLEHQKAIMAQVEEKRKKKQLEEEQRKWEEQEEEQRLARERELMQKQFEEDMLKQKQKEELMTLKTNELYQTMQKAQELAQRLKQEQRIRDLAQKGHDISKLQKNLGGVRLISRRLLGKTLLYRQEEQLHKNHLNGERSESPPVPAVKNRLHQGQQKQIHTSNFLVLNNSSRKEKSVNTDTQQRSSPTPVTEPGRPPSSHFIPYVRTNEVYYLDPDAPVTRPSTHEPQYQQFNDSYPTSRLIFSSDHIRDPLLNPDVVKIRERQQAILKGLSELRQGLLQKQKELETGLIPAIAQEESFSSPF
ncbi:coiled-coil domain-containing protein 66 isoform X5 [Apteryx mantelli]|uniref:Coiled-coil domain-containing protein 66 isoform X5 n=1 Tax=Apteryx mantelli TaxID=2696672 RepID=A0ABM4F4J8_9AVES